MEQISEKEFSNLVSSNRGIIYKVIRLYINNAEDERDLFQEILFQAWKSYPRFDGRSKFSTWLYRVGLNTVLTFKRRPALIIPHEDLAALNVEPARDNKDEAEALYQAIRELPEVDRMIVTLHLDGYDNEEIAEITGLTKNNTAVKLHRIKDVLIKKFNAQ
ncbi:MAG: sigma-70 family RNA polymerase sigma factor [Cytophagales bacterium]|nr:sigma-70 family RNA polymerase sigma factor [Cytophagales bacterium]